METDFKTTEEGRAGGEIFIPTYAADPMLIIFPLKLKGYMISMGSAEFGRVIKSTLADPYSFFLKLLSIPIVHLRNTHALDFPVVCFSVQTSCTTFARSVFMAV